MVKPAQGCCGCFTLLSGVETICLFNLVHCIIMISLTSSVEPANIGGIIVSPVMQVAHGAWCLIGIPVIICAGVGAIYRVESHLRIYTYYLLATFIVTIVWWMSILTSGNVCATVVSEDMQKMGTSFVCGFTDAFAVFWMLIGSVIYLYCTYIVWSAAEEVSKSFFPELVAFKNKMHAKSTGLLGGYS